jgi:prevent-host-death family protein
MLVSMVSPGRTLPLSAAKAKLSEVIRAVRQTGEPVVITVDGEPAVQLAPVPGPLRELSGSEVATVRSLMWAIARIPRAAELFDALAPVSEGRR